MTARGGKTAENKYGALVHKVFYPAISVLNRLKYLQKFILISAFFAVPIAVSMYLLISKNINYWEGFTRKEAEGVRTISMLRKLLEDVQTHRALAMIRIAGDASAADKLKAREAEVEEDFRKLSGINGTRALSGKRWKAIGAEWQAIKADRALAPQEVYGRHSELVRELRIMMEVASYDSGLILDPDSASFFLIDLIARDLPRLTERIERLNALGSYALARQRLGADEKEQLLSVSVEVRDSMEALSADLELLDSQPAFAANAALRKVGDDIRMIISGSEDYLKLVDSMIIRAGKPRMPHWEFFTASTAGFFRPIYEAYDTSGAALIAIFSARTERLAWQSMTAWGVTAIIVALVLYLLAGFYVSVTDTVSRLGAAARQMDLTGLPEAICLEGRDEMNEAVTLFNEVALALRRSHEVLLHSERLARVGSWDLDAASGTMQWSPEMYMIYGTDASSQARPGIGLLFQKVHPDDARMMRENIEKGITAGSIPLFEYRLVLNGSVRHLSCEGEARGGAGTAAHMTGFVQDITERKNAEETLRDALNKVKLLSGLLPICASCKKIRNDKGYWESIEQYIEGHSEAEFSHSICDECAKRLYPDFYGKRNNAG